VRIASYAAVLLVAGLLAAGCADDGSEEASWPGPPTPAEDGSVDVGEFADYQESVDEPWERSAETAAAEFLRLDERTAIRTTIEGRSEAEVPSPRAVTVTFDGLLDDSVRAERWILLFELANGTTRLTSAIRTLACNPGRGHEDFTAEPCL
jgi:hypothetical protein